MGPLAGIRVIELAGLGPGPFCAMMLADMGAEVIRIDRKTPPSSGPRLDVLNRGRRSMTVDLKNVHGVQTILRLVDRGDALIEGFRPGVMERLGLGPEDCLRRNPRLVYGRMTGWGQNGPLAKTAGHDINFIAMSGALHAIGSAGDGPVLPLNLVGDFGGGGMMLAFGIACALLESRESGKGQVVDAAMTDGSAILMAPFYGLKAAGEWSNRRGTNFLDGGAHFYNTYECADGKWVAIGAVEPQFYALLLDKMEIRDESFHSQMDSSLWPSLKIKFASIFKTKTRAEWCKLLEGCDLCFSPVLDFDEAPEHPHNAARKTFIEVDGVIQPAPAPRFSRTLPETPRSSGKTGQDAHGILSDWGFKSAEITALKADGVI